MKPDIRRAYDRLVGKVELVAEWDDPFFIGVNEYRVFVETPRTAEGVALDNKIRKEYLIEEEWFFSDLRLYFAIYKDLTYRLKLCEVFIQQHCKFFDILDLNDFTR